MFNDFKFLTFNNTKQKLGKLKDIFDRLSLPFLEERRFDLKNKIALLDTQFVSLKANCDAKWPTTPPGPIEPPTPPEPPVPVDLPDLSVSIISALMWNDSINFTVTVTNIGAASSSATVLNNAIPPVPGTSVSVPALAVGESFITVVPYVFNPIGIPENKTFLSEVNPSRTFLESTYINNSNSSLFTVKTPYPPETLLPDFIISDVSSIIYDDIIPIGGDGYLYHGIYYFYPYGQPRTVKVENYLVTVKNIGTLGAGGYCKVVIIGQYPVIYPSGPGDPIPNLHWVHLQLGATYWEIPFLNPGESTLINTLGWPSNDIIPGFIWMPVPPPHGEGWYPRKIGVNIEANPLIQYNYGHPLYPGYYRVTHESSYINNTVLPINYEIEGAFYQYDNFGGNWY